MADPYHRSELWLAKLVGIAGRIKLPESEMAEERVGLRNVKAPKQA